VIPAALALGEHLGCDGQRFLRAVTLGYDVGPRMGMALGANAYQTETHHSTHKIAGEFGAAAAAAGVAAFNARQMRWVLDYAAQQAAGIVAWQRDTDHIEKSQVFGGFAARNAVASALLIAAGGTGVDDVFSGDDNFFLAFGSGSNPSVLVVRLCER